MKWLLLIALASVAAPAAEWKVKSKVDALEVIGDGYPMKFHATHTRAGTSRDLALSFPQYKSLIDAIDAITISHSVTCESETMIESQFGTAPLCPQDPRARTLLGDLRRFTQH